MSTDMQKEIFLIKVLCSLAFLMTAIMFFSPGFPARSGFSGTLLLIIATGMLLRFQDDYGIELILPEAKKFLLYVGIVFFVMTSSVTFYFFYKTHIQMQEIILSAKTASAGESVLIVPPIEESGRKEDLLSGFHIPTFKLSENENDWTNVAFSRYYGIKGIRMVTGKENTAN